MLLVAGSTFAILLFMGFIGFPLAKLVIGKNENSLFSELPFVLCLSLLFGFFLSALSSSISYGVIGLDFYPATILILGFLSWAVYLRYIKKNSLKIFRIPVKRSDSLLLVVAVWCLVLTRTQWDSITKPKLVSGDGPDTSQNLMTALSARSLGDTWRDQADNINKFFGHDSLRQTVFDLYRYPSFRDQAGFDYLVFGTRWGLSIPYSQVLRFFGDKAILWETGIVITTSLIVLGIMVYGILSVLSKNSYVALAGSLIAVSNSLLLVQYFNGGLSQVWSLPGILGISIVLIFLVTKSNSEIVLPYKSMLAISVAAWTILIATYVDAAIILGLLGAVVICIFLLIEKQISINIFKNFAISFLIALIINPVLTYATILTFDLRLRAATGTGIATGVWALPSEIFGFVDVFSSTSAVRSFETMLLGVLISVAMIHSFARKILRKEGDYFLGYLSLSSFFVILIGFLLSYTGKLQTNYIYNKVSVYVTPIIIILWLASFKQPSNKTVSGSGKKKSVDFTRHISKTSFLTSLTVVTVIAMSSAVSATNSLSKQGTSIPYEFAAIMDDQKTQARISQYNYLTPYILSANFLGVIGNFHWVSKAPNDIKLDTRASREMRLICYSVDSNCKPLTRRISDPELEKYGFIQYESPISSLEFSRLSPKDRYRVNFEVFGLEPQEIPERFIGGNPYYN